MKTISILNQKGGVGKTTTTLNVAKAIANKHKKVLLIDLDPQAHLSTSLNVFKKKYEKTFYTIKDLIDKKVYLKETIYIRDNLDIIPSDIFLNSFERENVSTLRKEYILEKTLKNLENCRYDYIFIDNNPSLDLLMINSLVVSNYVLIPTKLDYLSLHGTADLLKTINVIKNEINKNLKILGIVGTFYDNTNEAKESLSLLNKILSKANDIKLFKTYIRQCTKLKEAPKHGKSIFDYAPKCNGAIDYQNLANEIMEMI